MYELSLPDDDEQPDNVVVAKFGGPEPVPSRARRPGRGRRPGGLAGRRREGRGSAPAGEAGR
ncbi:hypothetical protein ACFQX6_10785 [Streptosporangium lutulentum]